MSFNSQVFSAAIYADVDPEVANILTAVGAVTDAQAVVVANDKSLMSYVKGILTTVLGISGSSTEVAIYGPQMVDVDNIGHFEIYMIDKIAGQPTAANIVAGNYQLNRIRAGVVTAIGGATAFSKADGRVYTNITFATADWNTDDAFQIVPDATTSYTISGHTHWVALPTISGIIQDISSIETKIDGIKAVTDVLPDAGALTSLAQDLTVAKEATLGIPVSVAGTLVGDIADVQTEVDKIGTLVNTGGTAELGDIIGDVNNVSIATQLANIYAPHTWAGSISATTYVDAGAEQIIVEIVPGANMLEVNCIFLDLVNMTQNGTIKTYIKIDGTNYREVDSSSFVVATDSDGVYIDLKCMIMDDLKITYTEGADEGADRSIPWQYVIRSV